jgi:hypothetical protein
VNLVVEAGCPLSAQSAPPSRSNYVVTLI